MRRAALAIAASVVLVASLTACGSTAGDCVPKKATGGVISVPRVTVPVIPRPVVPKPVTPSYPKPAPPSYKTPTTTPSTTPIFLWPFVGSSSNGGCR